VSAVSRLDEAVSAMGAYLDGPLSTDHARRLTDEVKADAAALWSKLLTLYEGEAHAALGYASWADYYSAEFGQSASRGYQLLDAARVHRLLGQSTFVEPVREAVARELVPVMRTDPVSLPAVMAEATQRSGGAPVTAATVRAVVRDRFRSMAAESEAEMQAATAHYTPEQRAAVAPERMRQLGEFTRLIHDLAALPDPTAYAESFGRWLTPEFRQEAATARRWLEALLRRLEAA